MAGSTRVREHARTDIVPSRVRTGARLRARKHGGWYHSCRFDRFDHARVNLTNVAMLCPFYQYDNARVNLTTFPFDHVDGLGGSRVRLGVRAGHMQALTPSLPACLPACLPPSLPPSLCACVRACVRVR